MPYSAEFRTLVRLTMNKKRIYKTSLARISAICLLAVALVLVLFSCSINCQNIAFSVSPKNYIDQVVNENKDWYMGEDYLDLNRLKSIVEVWKYDSKYNFDGIKPVVIAVVDSGIIADHEIFEGKYDSNGNPITSDGVGKYDVLYRNKDGSIVEICTENGSFVTTDITDVASNYHGTHVAGIIATFIHELNLEQYIKIMPVRAGKRSTSGASFSASSIALGINQAIANGADIVNLSVTSNKPGNAGWGAVGTAKQAEQAVLIAAAGNNGAYSGISAYYPAASSNVIGVMNYTKSESGKVLAGNSNYGSVYDVCAPGANYYSANGADKDGYFELSGTSMATPVVSFGAALKLLKSRAYANANPNTEELTPIELAKEVRGAVEKDSVVKNITSEKYDAFDMCALVENDDAIVRIEVSEDSESTLEQRINNVKPITLRLKGLSAAFDEEAGTITWYSVKEDDTIGEEIGKGAKFVYMPKNEVHTERITAVWSLVTEDTQYVETAEYVTIKVDYVEFSPSFVRELELSANDDAGNLLTGSQIRTGVEYEFCISDVDLSAISDDTRIYWFVNGSLKWEGKTFKYTFVDKEKAVVTVRINDQFCKEFIVDFEEEIAKERALESLEIFTIVAGGCIVLAIAIVFVVLAVKKKNVK